MWKKTTIQCALSFMMMLTVSLPWTVSADIIEGNTGTLKMLIRIGSDHVEHGDPLAFFVTVFNGDSKDVRLEFRSSNQVDYTIDGEYRYSSNHGFTEALTYVTIPADGSHTWEFKHTGEDFKLDPGVHIIRAELLGTDIWTEARFAVNPTVVPLPEGIQLSVSIDDRIYEPGQNVDFELTATNTTGSGIVINVVDGIPLKYRVVRQWPDSLNIAYDPERMIEKYNRSGTGMETIFISDASVDSFTRTETETIIPAGESLKWTGHIADNLLYVGGTYHVFAGLRNYPDEASATFEIADRPLYGTVNGSAIDYGTTSRSGIPVEGAEVSLKPLYRGYYRFFMLPNDSEYPARTTVTDAEGRFSFDNVEVGWYYRIDIVKEGYVACTQWHNMQTPDMFVQAAMKKEQEPHTDPLNYTTMQTRSIEAVMGAGRYIFEPEAYIKGYMRIFNATEDAIEFRFEDNNYVTWTLTDADGKEIWRQSGSWSDSDVVTAGDFAEEGNSFTLDPKGSREFLFVGNLPEMVSEGLPMGRYRFGASLNFTACSDGITSPGDIDMEVTIAVADVKTQEVRVASNTGVYMLDLKESVNTMVNVNMRSGAFSGEMNVAELRENIHDPLNNHRFVKIIEIDAAPAIRDDLDGALVRIYYDEGDSEKPANLVIAHWTGGDNAEWKLLDSYVNETERYVEAYTDGFSSFGLFENSGPVAVDEAEPTAFALSQNYPNPFNPSTSIDFTLPTPGNVSLVVYNAAGQEVARLVDGGMTAGSHRVVFDGNGMASGVYFYRITTGSFTATKRMLMIK